MTKQTEKTTGTHDDGIKKTEHTVIVKRDDDGNTRTYHGSGGKDGKHTTEHKDGSIHHRERPTSCQVLYKPNGREKSRLFSSNFFI